jgi:hypothetical protein
MLPRDPQQQRRMIAYVLNGGTILIVLATILMGHH